MEKSLTVVGGANHGRVIPIIVTEFRIGREAMCHLRPASTDISRLHCAFVTHPDGRVFLRDYGSSNGTVINHRYLIGGEYQLYDGDLIEVGPLVFRFHLQSPMKTTQPNMELEQNTTPIHPSAPVAPYVPAPIAKPILPGLTTISSVPSPRTMRDESALETSSDMLSDSNIFSCSSDDSYEMPVLETLPNSKIAHQAVGKGLSRK